MKAVPKPKKGTARAKKKYIESLKNKLQVLFNRWIVLRDGGCITCGSTNNLQASHYFSVGSAPAVRYNDENAHAQCAKCHLETHNKGGYRYAMAMLNKYGEEKMDDLLLRSSMKCEYSEEWLLEKIQEYTNRINAINAS